MTGDRLNSLDDERFSPDHRLPQNPAVPEQQVVVAERRGLDGVTVNLVDSVDDAMNLMRWLGERREVLAVDTETTGLNAWAGRLRLVQIGDAMTGWAIPWDLWGGVFIDAMRKYEGPLVGHNWAFDSRWFSVHSQWRTPWHRMHDTMIMAHVIDPTQVVGLKHLGDRFIDRRASAGEQLLKKAFHDNKWDWATVPVTYGPYWEYGALDTVLTARLYEIFRADQRYPEVYDLEMATRRICSQMEDNGAPVDLAYCESMFDQLSQYVDDTKKWFEDNHKVRIGSTTDLVRWLLENGQKIERTTPKGKPSADKYQLRLLAKDFPLAKVILDVRKADKIAQTYFANFLSKAVDGVLHCQIRTLGARTGRMSITDPALQTLPKGEAIVRNAFVPHEGRVLISADWSQIEMRLMAHFSQDPALCEAFKTADATGGDFFVELGKQIYRDPNFTKDNPLRGLVKNTLYGAAYGAGVDKMAETAGVPYEVMKEVSDTVFSSYPGIRRYQREVEQLAGQRELDEGVAYIYTPFGRRLPADSGRAYTLVNYGLQGHAAELLKRALVHLDQAGLSDYLVLPIHDEIIASVPKEDAEDVKRLILECMNINEGYLVPIPAEADGPLDRWGRKYEKKAQAITA